MAKILKLVKDILILIVIIIGIITGVYFILGWHKGEEDEEITGTITDPDHDKNISRAREISNSINRLFGYSSKRDRDG